MGFWNNGGFFRSIKGHVFKWWQLVIMPVLHINNNNKSRQTPVNQSTPNTVPMTQEMQLTQDAVPTVQQEIQAVQSAVPKQEAMASQPVTEMQQSAQLTQQPLQEIPVESKPIQQEVSAKEHSSMPTEDPMEVLRRINEEKEEQRRKEIEAAKKKASEEARIAAIMNANKVDVNAFIEAGKAAKEEIAAKKADEKAQREFAEQKAKEVQQSTTVKAAVDAEIEKKRKQEDDLRRAQEIMDRLNREAAEDEAKKQAEIDAAKQEAKKQFG